MVKNSFRHVAFDSERLIVFMEKTRAGGFARSTLRLSQVERVRENGEDASTLVLISGFEIPVAMTHETLTQKIFSPDYKTDDTGVLDLIAVTGEMPEAAPEQAQKQAPVRQKKVVQDGQWQPGDRLPDGSIYLGVYAPEGHGLSQVFNVFAAPQDLSTTGCTYADTLYKIGRLKDWFGYDGARFDSENELYHAIATGTYDGGWIVPPLDILVGKDINGVETVAANILANKAKGGFMDTLALDKWYWSAMVVPGSAGVVCNVNFSSGRVDKNSRDSNYVCRPVRLVQISP